MCQFVGKFFNSQLKEVTDFTPIIVNWVLPVLKVYVEMCVWVCGHVCVCVYVSYMRVRVHAYVCACVRACCMHAFEREIYKHMRKNIQSEPTHLRNAKEPSILNKLVRLVMTDDLQSYSCNLP